MTAKTYKELKRYVDSTDDFTEDLINYGYTKGRAEAERDFQNSDYWNDYLAKVLADERNKAIEDCKEVVRQHWINGTVAHRIAEEIYGDLEKLKEDK